MIGVKVTGDKKAAAKFRTLKKAVPAILESSVKAGALVVETAAKHKAPKETGSLARSMHTEIAEVNPAYAKAIVGTDLEYAAQVEFGGKISAKNAPYLVFKTKDGKWHKVKSVTQVPQPYLRPALDEHRAEVVAVMSSTFKKLMKVAI